MKLIRFNASKWLLTGDQVYISGTFEEVKTKAVELIEIEPEEFDRAAELFMKHDHNIADIGVAHTVIFTERVKMTEEAA